MPAQAPDRDGCGVAVAVAVAVAGWDHGAGDRYDAAAPGRWPAPPLQPGRARRSPLAPGCHAATAKLYLDKRTGSILGLGLGWLRAWPAAWHWRAIACL